MTASTRWMASPVPAEVPSGVAPLNFKQDPGRRQPELQGHADGRYAGVGGFLVGAQLPD